MDSGKVVLVTAAAGGTGQFAVQVEYSYYYTSHGKYMCLGRYSLGNIQRNMIVFPFSSPLVCSLNGAEFNVGLLELFSVGFIFCLGILKCLLFIIVFSWF